MQKIPKKVDPEWGNLSEKCDAFGEMVMALSLGARFFTSQGYKENSQSEYQLLGRRSSKQGFVKKQTTAQVFAALKYGSWQESFGVITGAVWLSEGDSHLPFAILKEGTSVLSSEP